MKSPGKYEMMRWLHARSMTTKWIYESPDGGKTIYRRPFGKHDQDRQIQVAPDVWFSLDQLRELGKHAYQQQCLRYEYPTLAQLWEEYHTMLKIVSNHGE